MSLLWLILLLLFGGMVAGFSERFHANAPRWVALGVIAIAGAYLATIPIGTEVNAQWIPRFGISLILSMDGLSLAMVALTLFLGLVAIVSSWTEIEDQHGFFQFNLLWTLAGVVGVFTALDLFLFFVFWEVMLVPMYFLIAVWGHEDRAYAAMKFFLFTQISGLLLLFAILALVYFNYAATGVITFSYADLLNADIEADVAFWLMLGFFVAFVVKLPSVPFHTWLADAHTQAPTAGSVILAGILLKTGAYGLIRFVVPLFPDAAMQFRWPAMLLGAVSVVYGGYLAYSQSDFKRLVAYSSVSHMGFVLLGVFAWNALAVQGAVVQMVAHGFSTAALFMVAGALQQRLHTREMGEMGGLWVRAPRMGAVAMFFVIASVGMPGLGNFIGEFLVLLGAFQVDVPLTVAAAVGMVVAVVYGLSLMQRSFQGEPNPGIESIADFGAREMSVMVLMMIALVWLGVYPQTLLSISEPVVSGLGVAP
ncbi:MAG: NADH-quinone oxidoreductase subunit M [Gammaproteobacteria bacterium]|nr:NADH-quinone oxidoreductase subunit M [Gammaproteobacteria bacterium]